MVGVRTYWFPGFFNEANPDPRLATSGQNSFTSNLDRPRYVDQMIAAGPSRIDWRAVDWRLELVNVPVSDVDRAKAFYVEKAGFNADHDHAVSDEIRFVQLTPPGSACSISIGTGLSDAAPGSVQGLQLVVDDINAAHAELAERGVEVSDVQEFDWGSFVFFSDPDGNRWAVQAIPARD